jgi:hypothetical protein
LPNVLHSLGETDVSGQRQRIPLVVYRHGPIDAALMHSHGWVWFMAKLCLAPNAQRRGDSIRAVDWVRY